MPAEIQAPSFLNTSLTNQDEHKQPPSSDQDVHLRNVIRIIQAQIFGAKEWKQAFDIDVPSLKIPQSMIDFLLAPDVKNGKPNYLTHLPPILLPQFYTISPKANEASSHSKKFLFSLEKILALSNVDINSQDSTYKSIISRISERSGYLVARKKLLFCGQSAQEQETSMRNLKIQKSSKYQPLPSILQIATVSLIHHIIHKTCFFSKKGIANCVSLCKQILLKPGSKDFFLKHAHVGCNCSTKKANEIWGGLDFDVYKCAHSRRHGVLAVRMFYDKPYKPSKTEDQKDCKDWELIDIKDEREGAQVDDSGTELDYEMI